MNWDRYKEEVKRYRIECTCNLEYISILLLGIAESCNSYKHGVVNGVSPSKQVELYGVLLWNVAELSNVMVENYKNYIDHMSSSVVSSMAGRGMRIASECAKTVRKNYIHHRNEKKFLLKASAILSMCEVNCVASNIAEGAMVASVNRLKNRYGK